MRSDIDEVAAIIWKLEASPTAKLHGWKILRQAIPSDDKLKGIDVVVSNQCVLCKQAEETIQNLFVECKFRLEDRLLGGTGAASVGESEYSSPFSNCDSQHMGNLGPSGGGVIMRNHEGQVLVVTSNFYGCCSKFEAGVWLYWMLWR
ncbi:unnamed protein product [Ilex paraguariensis]|uniref:Reverse transcriptase zinc-binding domain-containing protein n=1 Tax=Ilex paraguariensis TaxID=185542 RepID=A0ABC8TLU3_9AQUA